jgi:hypothetical protein
MDGVPHFSLLCEKWEKFERSLPFSRLRETSGRFDFLSATCHFDGRARRERRNPCPHNKY